MANVTRLDVDIGAKTDRLKSGIQRAEGNINSFKQSVIKLAGAFAAAFSVRQLFRFGTESVKLADQQLVAEQKLLTALKGRRDIQQRLISQAKVDD